jgi:predicted transcriptional regulator
VPPSVTAGRQALTSIGMRESILSGMPVTTSIKVPAELRDRLAARALRQHTTLAGAIARALDESDEREFWEQVREGNARLADDERSRRVDDMTLGGDLADPADDALAAEDW